MPAQGKVDRKLIRLAGQTDNRSAKGDGGIFKDMAFQQGKGEEEAVS